MLSRTHKRNEREKGERGKFPSLPRQEARKRGREVKAFKAC